jgi:hypothetical protein
MNSRGNISCICINNFSGLTCGFNSSNCPSTCNNGGSCIPSNNNMNGYVCNCARGFTGKNCESLKYFLCLFRKNTFLKIKTGVYNPCLNDGQPIFTSSLSVGFYCNCTQFFAGSLCQYKSPCASSPCKNNGMCVALEENNGGFLCDCQKGFFGDLCDRTSNSRCADTSQVCLQLASLCSTGTYKGQKVSNYCKKTCKVCTTKS